MKRHGAHSAVRQLWLGAVLLTRLPLPRLPDQAFADSARAVWTYPIIGAGLAAMCGVAGFWAVEARVSAPLAAGFVLALLAGLTGAMHEDGLADMFDGFWGGFTRARRLEIMKDSQIGTYGVMALVLTTGLRWCALSLLLPLGPGALIAVAATSRAAMVVLMSALPHARDSGLSHSVGRPSPMLAGVTTMIALALAFFILGFAALLVLLATAITVLIIGVIAHRKIIGQTGDVLGATQVLSETSALLLLAVLLA